MRILVDIGHPAQIYYFKNLLQTFIKKGYVFSVIARKRPLVFELLNSLGITYKTRGSGGRGIFGKFLYLPFGVYNVYKEVLRFKPDMLLGFCSIYAAISGLLGGRPSIIFDDTDHAWLTHFFYKLFPPTILTPSCYRVNLGDNQIRFNGYMELCYLHPKYFKPDKSILRLLGVKEDEKYVILRFVSWQAMHDLCSTGISAETRYEVLDQFSRYAKVFISSEIPLPVELRKYQLSVPPERIHDVLYYATLYYGEGATMATESAILGTPAIYINKETAGVIMEEEKYGLMFRYTLSLADQKKSIEKGMELLTMSHVKQEWQKRRQAMLSEKIDVTAFMVWFIENYPESLEIMKRNPEYQRRFM